MFNNAAGVRVSPSYKLSGINLKWPSGFFNPLIKCFQDNISKGSKGHVINIQVHGLCTHCSHSNPTRKAGGLMNKQMHAKYFIPQEMISLLLHIDFSAVQVSDIHFEIF